VGRILPALLQVILPVASDDNFGAEENLGGISTLQLQLSPCRCALRQTYAERVGPFSLFNSEVGARGA